MKVNTLTPRNKLFPSNLGGLHKPPKLLYLRGTLPKETTPIVAIVGARKATPYGIDVATTLAHELAGHGIWTVSGLAFGIDSAAHKGSLQREAALAVLPGPVDKIYPRSNQPLADEILNNGGGLLSEYPSGSPVYKHSFLERNRIIAALADAVVIVEAAQRSGSLNTARSALDMGKPVLAVPGSIRSPTSSGTNSLIASGARPYLGIEDVLEEIGYRLTTDTARRLSTAQQQHIYDLILSGTNTTDQLSYICEFSASQLTQILTELEIDGAISRNPAGGWIARS